MRKTAKDRILQLFFTNSLPRNALNQITDREEKENVCELCMSASV